jgi:predicted kinase
MIDVPELSLVALVGISGSGKSTFAAKHFAPTQVLSSDYFRGLVADDENDQSASADAFDVLHYVAGKRLAAGRLTVVDATNLQPHAREGPRARRAAGGDRAGRAGGGRLVPDRRALRPYVRPSGPHPDAP